MNFQGSTPQVIPRFGSPCSWDDPSQLPLGLARVARNVRYTADSVATRFGFTMRITLGSSLAAVGGFGILRYLPQVAPGAGSEFARFLAYTQDGYMWDGDPFVQASVASPAGPFPVQVGLSPVFTQAFNRGMVALGNLSSGVQQPLIYDPPTRTLDGVSDQPWGFTWTPNTFVRIGQVCSPTVYAQKVYRCTRAGTTTGTEPVWPTGISATINDGFVVWQENTPLALAALPDPAAPIIPVPAYNASSPITIYTRLYVALTYVNQQGEGINELVLPTGGLDPSKVLIFQNSGSAPVQVAFTLPPIPSVIATSGHLGVPFGATGYNVYVYIQQGVADLDAAMDPSYYAQQGGTLGPGSIVVVSSFPVGASLNQVNTAAVNPVDGTGAVDVGVRWMVPMFQTRTGYQTGWNGNIPFRVNVTNSGQKVLILRAPTGPPNMTRRLFGFTVAGASAAGPYTYVDAPDVESPGFNESNIAITATTIEDNFTDNAVFNFTDTYLPGATDVTNYADRVQVPPCSHVYFSKTLSRVIYTGCVGYDHLISDITASGAAPEAVRIPGSNLLVSSNDGDRCVCWSEVRETQVSMKENSGHAVIANDGDPNTWDVQELWRGMGPVGPKAQAAFADDDSAFILFAHRTGLYRYDGSSAKLVCRELLGTPENPGLWDQINWAYGPQIVVMIDSQRRVARIAVPFGTSTINNRVLSLNFFYGWSDPVVFSVRTGKLVPNVEGRKWSLDDTGATDMHMLPQRYTVNSAQPGVDLGLQWAISGTDGALFTLTDGKYSDDHNGIPPTGIFSQWISVPGPNSSRNMLTLLGGTVSGIGSGNPNVYAYDQQNNFIPLSSATRTMTLSSTETVRDFGSAGTLSTGYGIGFDNGGVAGAWFEVHVATLYLLQKFTSQIG